MSLFSINENMPVEKSYRMWPTVVSTTPSAYIGVTLFFNVIAIYQIIVISTKQKHPTLRRRTVLPLSGLILNYFVYLECVMVVFSISHHFGRDIGVAKNKLHRVANNFPKKTTGLQTLKKNMIGNIKAQIYSKLEKIIVIEILKKLKKNNNKRGI